MVVFLKVKSKKTVGDTTSSNTLFVVELPSNHGGVVPWGSECRFKHLGTGKYLCMSRDFYTEDMNKRHLNLTKDIRNPDTLFTLAPVDQVEVLTTLKLNGNREMT